MAVKPEPVRICIGSSGYCFVIDEAGNAFIEGCDCYDSFEDAGIAEGLARVLQQWADWKRAMPLLQRSSPTPD